MKPNIFDRARLMVAQSSQPTTLREQLGKLAKRRRHYGRVKVKDMELPQKYWWQDRGDA